MRRLVFLAVALLFTLTPLAAPAPGAAAAAAEQSEARGAVLADPLLDPALDALDQTIAGQPLLALLAYSETPIRVAALPARARAGYIPSRHLIVVNRNQLAWASPESLAAVIGHETVHLRDDLNGAFDEESAWQCYQSELRAFKSSAEIWEEFYPGGKPDPDNTLEYELNQLVEWSRAGSDLDRLYSLGDRYHAQCG